MKKRDPNTYRKIWIEHYGPISKDEYGRSYEIHHIDSNPENNSIDNLIDLTIHEHYEIHYWQEDWAACVLISNNIGITPEEKSELARRAANKRIEDGSHHFIGNSNPVYSQISNSNHPFQKRKDGSSVGADMVRNGTHPFIGGKIQRDACKRRIREGIHNIAEINSYQSECKFCGRIITGKSNEKRHQDSCERKNSNLSK